jgi:hypothetical protein
MLKHFYRGALSSFAGYIDRVPEVDVGALGAQVEGLQLAVQ